MCDPVLITAILEEPGYFNGKEEKDKKRDVHGEGGSKNLSENSSKEKQKQK